MNTFTDRLIMLALFLVIVFIIWFVVEFFLFPYYKQSQFSQDASRKPATSQKSIFSDLLQGPVFAIVAGAILIIGIAIFSYLERTSQYQDLDISKSKIHMRVMADDFAQLKKTYKNLTKSNDQMSLNAFNRNLIKEREIGLERGKMFEGKIDANATTWYKRGLVLDELATKGHPSPDSYAYIAASLDNEHKWREADLYYAKAEKLMSQQLFSNNGKDTVSFIPTKKQLSWLLLTGAYVNGEYKGTVVCNARLQRLLNLVKDQKCVAALPFSEPILKSKHLSIQDRAKHYSILDLNCTIKDLRPPASNKKSLPKDKKMLTTLGKGINQEDKGKVLREQALLDLVRKAGKRKIAISLPRLMPACDFLDKITHSDFPNATLPGTFLFPTNPQLLMPETIFILDPTDYQKLKALSL